MAEKITQTAGRDALGAFAPEFAHFNDDVLFGENWNNTDIDLKTRSIITVVALMSSGITDSSLVYHLENAKNHGVSQKEIAAIITHVAFYVGWPKAWAVFNLAKDIWQVDNQEEAILLEEEQEEFEVRSETYTFHSILEFGLGDFSDTPYTCKITPKEKALIEDAKSRRATFDEDAKCARLYHRIKEEIHDQEEERYLSLAYEGVDDYEEDQVVPFDEIIFYITL